MSLLPPPPEHRPILPGLGGIHLIDGGEGLVDATWWDTGDQPAYQSITHTLFDVQDGDSAVEVDGVWHPLVPGTLIFFPAHHRHRRRVAGIARRRWLEFRLTSLSLDLRLAADGTPSVFPGAGHLPWSQAMALVPEVFAGGTAPRPESLWAIEGLVLQVIAARCHAGPVLATGPQDERVYRALRYLDDHHRERPSLGVVAAAVGWSPRVLQQRFQAVVGCSPTTYAHLRRMQEAHHLLTTTTWSLTTIAAQCGYDDPLHLSRLIRQHFGLSPRQLRNERRGGVAPSPTP